GGHPFAAGMALKMENLPLFTDAINRQLRQTQAGQPQGRVIAPDLAVTLKDLGADLGTDWGADLFKQLSLLEPCGMGNAVPKLLICNCWFEKTWHQKIKDPINQRKIQYIKASFSLRDESAERGFPGTWWGHYKEELPEGRCDVVVELDFNSFSTRKDPNGRYELRLVDLRPARMESLTPSQTIPIIDQRHSESPELEPSDLAVTHCPSTWQSLRSHYTQATTAQQPLVLAYGLPEANALNQQWRTLVGLAKYLSRTGQPVTQDQLTQRLQISGAALAVGLTALAALGFELQPMADGFSLTHNPDKTATEREKSQTAQQFLLALQEEQFRHQYFYKVPIDTAQTVMVQGH
ncbi:MAG: single-stranded-DNA-specific exonuclease RecJ, partial [Cyanobacteria bacterium P01_A01_bin.105]